MSSRIKLIMGTAQFGRGGLPVGARVNTVQDAQKLADVFISYGHDKLDTSHAYDAGFSEEIIGQLDIKGCTVDTKIHPMMAAFKAEGVKKMLAESAKALGSIKIQTLFLHQPDHNTHILETLRAVNDLYEEGAFEEFGLSNFTAWQVAEAVTIANNHGWVKPTVYQGLYNLIERNVEVELLPCLRYFKIRFYAYSPLASGTLSGHILTEADTKLVGGRWDPSVSMVAAELKNSFTPILPVIRELNDLLVSATHVAKNNVSLQEAALRWLQHHSKLDPDAGDRIIVGASIPTRLESILKDSTKGPLTEEVVKLLDNTWLTVKPKARVYFM